jgi:hypothetical protein
VFPVSVSSCRSASLVGLSWGAYASPPFCPAPFPGEVRRLALSAGASFLCLRPSERSFSQKIYQNNNLTQQQQR